MFRRAAALVTFSSSSKMSSELSKFRSISYIFIYVIPSIFLIYFNFSLTFPRLFSMVFQLFPEAVMHQRPPFFPLLILGLAYFAMGITALAVIGALPTIAQGLAGPQADVANAVRSEEHTFEIQSLLRILYPVF